MTPVQAEALVKWHQAWVIQTVTEIPEVFVDQNGEMQVSMWFQGKLVRTLVDAHRKLPKKEQELHLLACDLEHLWRRAEEEGGGFAAMYEAFEAGVPMEDILV